MDVSKENYENLVSLEKEIKEYKLDQPKGISFDEFLNEGVILETDEDEAVPEEEFDLYRDSKDLVEYLNPPCLAQLHQEVAESFDALRQTMAPITPDHRIYKKVIQEGHGDKVTRSSYVSVHYNAYLEFQDEPFDSSRLRSLQQKFLIGRDQVLPGLEMSVQTMQVGEISIFVVDPSLAYGPLGAPPRIPPNAEILYEIELLSAIENAADAAEYDQMSFEERSKQPFSKVYAVCTFEKNMGNELINKHAYDQAMLHYQRAILYLEKLGVLLDEEEKQRDDLLLKLYLNSSFCRLKLNDGNKTIWFARKALKIHPRSTKAMFRYAKGLMMKHCLSDAKRILLRASAIEPHNREIIGTIVEINQIEQSNAQQEKLYCRRMFENKTPTNKSPAELALEEKSVKKLREILLKFVELKKVTSIPIGSTYSPMELSTIKCIAEEYNIMLVEPSSEKGPYTLVKNI